MTTQQEFPTIQPVAEYEIHLFTHFRTVAVVQGDDGFLYTALAALYQVFGLNEERESAQIQQHTILRTKLVKAHINEKPEQLCLRIGFIGLWLINLSVDCVETGNDKENLITVQQNAAQVLEEAFCAGRLTECPHITELLQEDDPVAYAYKDAIAKMALTREQLVFNAQHRNVLCK